VVSLSGGYGSYPLSRLARLYRCYLYGARDRNLAIEAKTIARHGPRTLSELAVDDLVSGSAKMLLISPGHA
jgi:hypothetical protein